MQNYKEIVNYEVHSKLFTASGFNVTYFLDGLNIA